MVMIGHYCRDLHFAHVLSGKDAIGKELKSRGFRCATFDKLDCCTENILHPAGALWAAVLCMRVMINGVVHFGVDCSSFTWMSRATTGRHLDVCGDDGVSSVRAGNSMLLFLSWMGVYLLSKGVFYMVENPVGSIISHHPHFQALASVTQHSRLCTWLGAFGGSAPKPTHLWTTAPLTLAEKHLKRTKPKALQSSKKAALPWIKQGRWTNGRPALTGAGVYSDEFGKCFASLVAELLGPMALE